MNLQDFFTKYNGKYIDFDGQYGNQCVDLIKQYFQEFLNRPAIKGNANDYWRDISGFLRIKNTVFNWPSPGDLIVLNVGHYGHISICSSANLFMYRCFEQNNPINSPCHFGAHGYANVLGWLKPTQTVSQPVPLPKVPLKIAWIGLNLPLGSEFQSQVAKYSSNRIACVINEYPFNFKGNMDQETAYGIVKGMDLDEKFVFVFYIPAPGSSYYLYTTYSYPEKDCVITTCPGVDSRSLAFEFSHQLQIFYNDHRGNNPPVEVVDSNYPDDNLITSKYDSVSKFYL